VSRLTPVAWWGLAVSACLILYAYLLYPLLLALAARVRRVRPVAKAAVQPTVTVVMVVCDEERSVAGKLDDILGQDYPSGRIDCLVLSDGSRDGTDRIVGSYAARGVRLIRRPGPSGKPAALNVGVPLATGEIVVLCDARQRLAPDAIRALVASFADPTVGAVSGELRLRPRGTGGAEDGVSLYWRYEKWVRRAESRLDSTVGVTGALYAIRRTLFRPLDPRTILDDVAIPMAVVRQGYRVVFEPKALAFDEAAERGDLEYRRKVRTLAGNYQLIRLDPGLLRPAKNRLLWQLVSHKLCRLAVPWCLLVLLVSSALLAGQGHGLLAAATAVQCAFYALALAGWGAERVHLRVRALSFPYAFALLNLAAASSLLGFLRGTQRSAWKDAVS
jgi:cellulose synthase/poly-beta-1,6-N-acetylglucosamine synthase-like glycosyltransferase